MAGVGAPVSDPWRASGEFCNFGVGCGIPYIKGAHPQHQRSAAEGVQRGAGIVGGRVFNCKVGVGG